MNRRSFIRTITATGVSLFLPKVIEPMRWKRTQKPLSELVWFPAGDHSMTGVFNPELTEKDIQHMLNTIYRPSRRPPEFTFIS